MLDVAVIGAGFWGSAISHRLRQSGRTVLCLDGALEGAASRAAAGLVRRRAWQLQPADWWGERHSQACREFFHEGWVVEQIFNRRSPQPRVKGEVWAGRFPWVEAVSARVRKLRNQIGFWVVTADTESWSARAVVLAAGCWCDSILQSSGLLPTGVRAVRGTAVLAPGRLEGVLTRTYRLGGDTRTRSLTARPWQAGCVRVGDSLPEREAEQREEMRAFLNQLGVHELEWIWGLRPRLEQPLVRLWAPGLVVATGGYRNGLAIAPGVAARVQELLEG